MSETAIAKRRAFPNTPDDTPKRIRLGHKLKIAIDAIVFEGMAMDKAAKKANCTTRAIRKALERRHVVSYLKERREVFRQSISAQNIFHAQKIRDRSGNAMAKLGAMKYIDGVADEQAASTGKSSSPGVVIVITNQTDAKPLIEHVIPQKIEGNGDA